MAARHCCQNPSRPFPSEPWKTLGEGSGEVQSERLSKVQILNSAVDSTKRFRVKRESAASSERQASTSPGNRSDVRGSDLFTAFGKKEQTLGSGTRPIRIQIAAHPAERGNFCRR